MTPDTDPQAAPPTTRRKGIILAGGSGTRLRPVTYGVSKQLLPVHDKPMIYYPLSVLMLAGIREIMIISTPGALPAYQGLLEDGQQFGLELTYAEQPEPEGIAQAYRIASEFLAGQPSALILGDNIFHGPHFTEKLSRAAERREGATLFTHQVRDPSRFGVVELDANDRPCSIEEKPARARSPHAITGLYFFDGRAPELARSIERSERGEFEITDLQRAYLEEGSLAVERLGRGFAWLDAGTHESLAEATQYIRTIEHRQGFKVACLSEIAWRHGWIGQGAVQERIAALQGTGLDDYLNELLHQEEGA